MKLRGFVCGIFGDVICCVVGSRVGVALVFLGMCFHTTSAWLPLFSSPVSNLSFTLFFFPFQIDLVQREDVDRMRAFIAHLNPAARIIESTQSRVALSAILDTKLFDLDVAQSSAAWQRELATTHTPETVEYGISSFVFRAARPFHPARLHALIAGVRGQPWQTRSTLQSVLRLKGVAWLATRPTSSAIWGQAGAHIDLAQGEIRVRKS